MKETKMTENDTEWKTEWKKHDKKLSSFPFVSGICDTNFLSGFSALEYNAPDNDSRAIMFRDEADIKAFLKAVEEDGYTFDTYKNSVNLDPKKLIPGTVYIYTELDDLCTCFITSKEHLMNLLEKQWNKYSLNLLKQKKNPRNEKWTYVTTARHVTEHGIVTNETITDDPLHLFDTKEEAYKTALRMAEDEKESLNEGLDKTDPANENKNFTVIADEENMDEVKILFYEDENGHGEELVTRRIIKKVEAEQ